MGMSYVGGKNFITKFYHHTSSIIIVHMQLCTEHVNKSRIFCIQYVNINNFFHFYFMPVLFLKAFVHRHVGVWMETEQQIYGFILAKLTSK